MTVSTKIKALLELSGKDHADLAECLGISGPSLSNKLRRNSFSTADLVKIAELTGCSLFFETSDGSKITIDITDIKKETSD